MNKKMDKLLKFMAIGCCTFAIALIIVIQQNNVKIQKYVKSADAIVESYTSTESNSWDISATENDSVTATLNENGLLTISGTGAMKDWSYNTMPWYSVKGQIKSIKIENGITNIGNYSFYNCDGLIKVEIPNSVTSIGNDAFENCDGLTNVEIPSSVTNIRSMAFANCDALTNVEIPSSVTNIGSWAFTYCDGLTSIEVNENNTKYKDDNGVLYSKDGTEIIQHPAGRQGTEYIILGSVTSIGSRAFYDCDGLTNVEIPNSVTSIEGDAFRDCDGLTNVEIPSSVTSIGGYAFCDCDGLTNVEIPNTVTSIGVSAFRDCSSLTSIEVNENNTKYKDDNGVLYSKDGAEIIQYPEAKQGTEYIILGSVTSIGSSAFESCDGLTNVEIPSSVTSIGSWAFAYCYGLTNLEIPGSVTDIGNYAFSDTIITNIIDAESNMIELPNILKRAQDETDILYANQEFTLTNCTIEEGIIKINEGKPYAKIKINDGKLQGLTYLISYNSWDISEKEDKSVIATFTEEGTLTISGIGNMKEYAYNDIPWDCIRTKIINVTIGEGITNITADAFLDCDNLINVEIPASVTNIGEYVFSYCYSLKNINVHENNTNYYDVNGVLYTKDKTEIVKYPAGKTETEYNILNGVTSIGNDAFADCYNLMKIDIPDSVTNIGDWAFCECYNLITIDIPNNVTSIGEGAFYWCESLTNIYVPNGVTTIGYDAFWGCDNLTLLCHKETPAMTYAQENNIDYVIIMDKVQPKTKVQQIKQQMESNTEYKITDKNGEEITDTTYVTTGCKVEVSDGENYIIIVTGDANKDGQAEIKDILAINKHRLNKSKLQAEELLAGDVNGDGTADIKDIMQINKFRLGKINQL